MSRATGGGGVDGGSGGAAADKSYRSNAGISTTTAGGGYNGHVAFPFEGSIRGGSQLRALRRRKRRGPSAFPGHAPGMSSRPSRFNSLRAFLFPMRSAIADTRSSIRRASQVVHSLG